MIEQDRKTPIYNIFHEKINFWCLGVLSIYTAIVFSKTPQDTTILNSVNRCVSHRQHKTPKTFFFSIFQTGGV